VIPGRFGYERPRDALAAAARLAADPAGARVLGGGTWVVPEMSRGDSAPRTVVDLADAGLGRVEFSDGELRVGAMATYGCLLASAEVADVAPLLALVAGAVTGGWSIRDQGTVGGSVAAARPSSDVPGALVALGADAVVQGPSGTRRVAVADLIDGAMSTSLGPGELIAGFTMAPSAAGAGYYKLKRGQSSWPILTASALVSIQGGVCAGARLVLGGAAAVPVQVAVAEVLVGRAPTAAAIAEAARLAGDAVSDWWDDALAPGEYRAATAAPVARRALAMAFETEARGAVRAA
jgi:CO/xanthine dehydrogenase FAD-binding subunit